MREFRSLLKHPGVGLVLVAQLAARFPAGMYSLGILMHVEHAQGTYTAAGLVLAAFSLGTAVAGPIVSRQLSRFGIVPVMLITLAISVAAIGVLVAVPLNLQQMMILGAIGGAALPPVVPAARTLYPRLVPDQQIRALFNLDAALQEVIWVIGPVLITVLVGTISTGPALLVAATIQLLGGLLFTFAPQVRGLKIPANARKLGRVLQNRSVLLMMGSSLLLIGSFAAIEAAIVATFGEGSLNAGLVLAISSIGSLLGGLLAGNRPLSRWSLGIRMIIVAGGFGFATLGTGFWWLSIALFVAGLGCAPALAAVSNVIASSVDFADTAEAYGWIGTGQLLGASIGSAVAGIAIDQSGGQGGIAVSFVIVVLAALVAVVFRNAQPDLSAPVSTS